MKMKTFAVLLLAGVAAVGASRLTLMPPRSRLGREVRVFWVGSGGSRRLAEPGEHEVSFPCSHVEEEEARVEVSIVREPRPREDGEPLERTPEQVRELAAQGRSERVRFKDVFARVHYAGEKGAVPVGLPDGQRVPVDHTFLTRAGILCLCPAGEELDLARAAMPGDTIHVRGQVHAMPGFAACVVVEDVRFREPDESADEPPWTVVVRWQDAPVLSLSEPGERCVRVPCAHKPGATELIGLRLREVKMVDLGIGGETVTAELADRPETRSYGLQGREGLPANHGMLFFWPEALRPRFVMKSVSFPLSIAFIRADGTIVNTARMQPGNRRGVRPDQPVNYVLEMEQGWFREHDVKGGDRVEIP
ncbi:MAG: DUF192 domain-containing protein [Candidatus Brocadiia bacterium]